MKKERHLLLWLAYLVTVAPLIGAPDMGWLAVPGMIWFHVLLFKVETDTN